MAGSPDAAYVCAQCGWEDSRPDKCTRCGSLRASDAAKRHSPVIAPPLEYTGTERVVCSRCGTVEHPGWLDEICVKPIGLSEQRNMKGCSDCPHPDYCAGMEKCDAASVDPLDALEEKWRTEPADLAEWANRAFRTLELARRWRQSAREWEETARRGPEPS